MRGEGGRGLGGGRSRFGIAFWEEADISGQIAALRRRYRSSSQPLPQGMKEGHKAVKWRVGKSGQGRLVYNQQGERGGSELIEPPA